MRIISWVRIQSLRIQCEMFIFSCFHILSNPLIKAQVYMFGLVTYNSLNKYTGCHFFPDEFLMKQKGLF